MDTVNNHTVAHTITLDQKQELLTQFLFVCVNPYPANVENMVNT
jgi:hypothetical protein